jgi:hypothetical protein
MPSKLSIGERPRSYARIVETNDDFVMVSPNLWRLHGERACR